MNLFPLQIRNISEKHHYFNDNDLPELLRVLLNIESDPDQEEAKELTRTYARYAIHPGQQPDVRFHETYSESLPLMPLRPPVTSTADSSHFENLWNFDSYSNSNLFDPFPSFPATTLAQTSWQWRRFEDYLRLPTPSPFPANPHPFPTSGILTENNSPSQVRRVLLISRDVFEEKPVEEQEVYRHSDRFDAIYILDSQGSNLHQPHNVGANLQNLVIYLNAQGIHPEEITLEAHGYPDSQIADGTVIDIARHASDFDIRSNENLPSSFPSQRLMLIRTSVCHFRERMSDHIAEQLHFSGEFLFGLNDLNYYSTGDILGSRFPFMRSLTPQGANPLPDRSALIYVDGINATRRLGLQRLPRSDELERLRNNRQNPAPNMSDFDPAYLSSKTRTR